MQIGEKFGKIPAISLFQIDACHGACKISQSCARIQRRKTFI
jgi:hypothetical protein